MPFVWASPSCKERETIEIIRMKICLHQESNHRPFRFPTGRVPKTAWQPGHYDAFKTLFFLHLSRRLKCTIVIMRCPASGVRPSSVVVNFSHFWLLLWNHWTEFDETLQEGRCKRPLPSLCFSGRSEKQDGRPGLWLAETFSTSPLKPLNGINETYQEARSQRPLPSLCFSGRSEKQDGRPGLWLAETFSTSPLKPLNGIWQNFTGR